ncbi:MAG: tyrosine recombinase XerC [Oscillospiraceae bacterium]|nr:tyrosine recombinase XerC [Oscillospiraceae bacterium]
MKQSEFTDLPKLVQDYLNYLDVVKNKSELTVSEYALDLRTFFRYLMFSRGLAEPDTAFEQIDISGVNLDFIKTVTLNDTYAFLGYCRRNRSNDAASRARKAVAIRRFFVYLSQNLRLIDENPMQNLELPKINKTLPKYLTLEQSVDLLACVDGKFRERDYCIITLFLNCGLRLSELVGLNLTDIRSDDTMRIMGKGGKERIIYLNDACKSALNRYLNVRPRDGVKDREALFISRQMRRMNPRSVEVVVTNFLKKSGLEGQGYSAHKLRHTAATLMYQHGDVDVLLIQKILGHANLSTTEIYTHVANEQLRKATEANPLSALSPPPDATDKNRETGSDE